ncbi:hypothetical protein [Castellaniella sp.]|uniref:hypothetical protein n=1 Tax=Castellaniella sp. TaxID=1955812 RepID=UPI002AFE80A8|nr:hypothetical protein [Castellaniella sp.]
MKQHRSYSDHEIACYVLGLDMPGHANDLQARLAHDDAAAACALKWEACFLGIVDALPPAEPPEALLLQIQATLGMEDMPITAEPRLPQQTAEPDDKTAGRQATRRRVRRLSWRRVSIAIGIGVAVVLIALLTWASLRPAPTGTLVQQPLQLQSN